MGSGESLRMASSLPGGGALTMLLDIAVVVGERKQGPGKMAMNLVVEVAVEGNVSVNRKVKKRKKKKKMKKKRNEGGSARFYTQGRASIEATSTTLSLVDSKFNFYFLFFASFILNPPFSSGQTPFFSSNVACSVVVLIERLGSEVPAFLPNSGDNSRIQHRLPLYTALP